MARGFGTSLAVPQAALAPSGAELAFEPAGWRHLCAWLNKVQALPLADDARPPEVAATLGALMRLAGGFGGPAQLKAARGSATMPAHAWPGFVWLTAQLQALAQETHALLVVLGAPASAPQRRRQALERLGELAATARDLGSPLLPRLEEFRAAILREHDAFAEALRALGSTLQGRWEAVGAQDARLQHLQAQLKATSALHPGRRKELAAAIGAAEEDLTALSGAAETLRLQTAALQAIGDEGVWLDASLGALIDFLHRLRAAWAGFGSSVTQLGADADAAQLETPDWIGAQLMLDEALPRWQALIDVSARFQANPGALPAVTQQAQKVGL